MSKDISDPNGALNWVLVFLTDAIIIGVSVIMVVINMRV